MPVKNLNHINIRAPQPLLDEVKDFYVNVVGLADGQRPKVSTPGYWLYAGDDAIVHLVVDSSYSALDEKGFSVGTSHLDHFAMTCTDIEGAEERFKTMNIAYRKKDVPEYGFSQLFLTDPTGMGVELNFPYTENE